MGPDLPLDFQEIPAQFTNDLGAMRSLGDEIIFVNNGALWRYVPGTAQPELLYQPTAGDWVVHIAGNNGRYAFVTQKVIRGYDPPVRWRLWYLAQANGKPVVVDQYDNDTLPSPTPAINDRYLVWTPYHGTGDQAQNELRVASLDDPTTSTTLASYPALTTNVMEPALYGDELWYATEVNDWNAGTEQPWIEMRNLADPAATPQKFGEDLRANMPAVSGEVVVWKGGGLDIDSALNSGQPYVFWRASGVVEPIADPHPALWDTAQVSYPSVGSRFVAWWDDDRSQFNVFDLQDHAVRMIADYDPQSQTRVMMPSVAGDLLAWVYSDSDNTPNVIRWAQLPD